MQGDESDFICVKVSWFALWDVQEILVPKVTIFPLDGFRNKNLFEGIFHENPKFIFKYFSNINVGPWGWLMCTWN